MPFVIVIVAVLAVLTFGATVKLIVPLPMPETGEVKLMKLEFTEALHVQPVGMAILKLPLPPANGKACPLEDVVKLQAVRDDCTFRLQPPMLPKLFPLSSTTKSFQTPFAVLPLNALRVVPDTGVVGAGDGNASPVSMLVGL